MFSYFFDYGIFPILQELLYILTMCITIVHSNLYNQLVCAERVVTTFASEPFKRSRIIPPPESPRKTNFDVTSNSNAVKLDSPA